jgi:hypothetical protein
LERLVAATMRTTSPATFPGENPRAMIALVFGRCNKSADWTSFTGVVSFSVPLEVRVCHRFEVGHCMLALLLVHHAYGHSDKHNTRNGRIDKQVITTDVSEIGGSFNLAVKYGNVIFILDLPPFDESHSSALRESQRAGRPIPAFSRRAVQKSGEDRHG